MEMKNNTNVGPQAERLRAQLLELRPDVTAKDRDEAMKEVAVNAGTISSYLNGKVRDNDTAVMLISFFRKCISKREKVINK